MKNRGFTLIELVVTVTIAIIIAGGFIYLSPKIIQRQRLKNDAWQIANDILEVKERARAQLEILKIEFYVRNDSTPELNNLYAWEKKEGAIQDAVNNGHDRAYIVTHPEEFPNIVVRHFHKDIGFPWYFGYTAPASVSFGDGCTVPPATEAASPPNKYTQIKFNEWGNPCSGGTIRIMSKSLRGTNGKPRIVELIVTPVTGRVRMEGPKDMP